MIYVFGDHELDDRRYELRHAGVPVEIERKVFDVLTYLIHHRDRLIPKDELLDKLWPEVVIGEAALTRCITAARKALGDDGSKQEIIKTNYGRGYRFVAAVTERTDEPMFQFESTVESPTLLPSFSSPSPALEGEGHGDGLVQPPVSVDNDFPVQSIHKRFWSRSGLALSALLLLVGIMVTVQYLSPRLPASSASIPPEQPLALPLPDKPSIVVLPFVNMSKDPEQEYFSDGITEEITSSLSRLDSLFVIARTSAFTYKGKAAKVQDICRELGVQYVLEGSIRKTNDQLRISTQLIDGTTGGHLWTEHYDRPLTDIFAVQDEIVQRIVTTLRLQLPLQAQGLAPKETDNLEAYDAYLRGVERYRILTPEANLQARQFCEQAIALDPQYQSAYALLGITYLSEWVWHWSTDPQTLEHAVELEQRAVALDDSCAPAHGALGLVYAQTGQLDRALAEIKRAIALEPNNADIFANQADVLNYAGRPAEAVQAAQRAIRLNPHARPLYLAELGWAYHLTDQYVESNATLTQLIARSPNFMPAYMLQVYNYIGQWVSQQSHDPQVLAQAYDAAQDAVALNDAFPMPHTALGFAYLWQKQYDRGITELERAVALDGTYVGGQMLLAYGLSLIGRVEEAVQVGERALTLKALPSEDRYLPEVVFPYYLAGRLEEAAALQQRLLKRFPNFLGAHLDLAAIYSELGREAEARAEAAEVLRLNPKFSLEVHRQRIPIKDPAVMERYIAALRKAGLK